MLAGALVLAALVQGPTPLARAESLLVAGDTAAALRILSNIPLDASLSDDGIAATFALVWIGRSSKWSRAQETFLDRTRPRLTEWTTGAAAAMVVQEDVEEGAKKAWHAGVTPSSRMADHLAGDLYAVDPIHSVALGATRWAVAEYDLMAVVQGLRDDFPVIRGQLRPINPDSNCTVLASPWVGIHALLGSCRQPSLARLVAADSGLAPHLARARRFLRSALGDPWPLGELSARTLVALELVFGDSITMRDLLRQVTEAGLPRSATTDLQAILLTFGGWPDRAALLMDEHADRFSALDTMIGALENRAHVNTQVLWRTGWPLYLEPWNERLVVHRARVLAADLVSRWTPPTFVQAINPPMEVIRRGFPVAVVQIEQHDTRIGETKLQKHLYFSNITETLLPASEQTDAGISTDVSLAATAPVANQRVLSGFAPAYYDLLLDLPHQAMRYQRDGKTLVDFFAQPPAMHDAGCQYERGMFLLDADYRMQFHVVDTLPHGRVLRQHYVVPVAPGSYVYSLEVRDTACRVAARARHTITVLEPRHGLSISDVLLAEGPVPVQPGRLDGGIPVVGRPGLVVSPLDEIPVYWEVYGVRSDSVAPDHLAIEVEAVDIRRGRVPVSAIGEVQHVADTKRSDAALRYIVTVPPGDGPLGDGVTLRIPLVSDAVFRVRVTVTDQATGATVTGTRTFYVRRPALRSLV